jgi:predicted nucleotidyltransferase component of viral defense system
MLASVRSRLANLAKESGQNFEDALYSYAIERFLYRFAQSRHQDNFVLKGGQVFAAWGVPLGRPTRDIDLRAYTHNAIENLEQIVREVCVQPVEADGLIFNPNTVRGEEIREDADYQGVRILFWGKLGNARIWMQVDIGFSDEITPADIPVNYPTLLGMPAPRLRGYPPETVIAEKLQAMVYFGEINSRMKDFYDIWLLSQRFDFEGDTLRVAITTTFRNRETPIPVETPPALTNDFATHKQEMWKTGFLGKFMPDPGELGDFQQVISKLRSFLLPLLNAAATGEAFNQYWMAGGDWRQNSETF